MKKAIFWFFIIAALAVVVYFVGLPVAERFISEQRKPDTPLTSEIEATEIPVWTIQRENVYVARPMPNLKEDFSKIGYPPFLLLADGTGEQPQKQGEKSFHENGDTVYLYFNDDYYTNGGMIEIAVDKSKYNAANMPDHNKKFIEFIEIITGNIMNSEDKKALLRMTSDVINMGLDWKPGTVRINGTRWTFELFPTTYSMTLSY